jgi:hypothetical protein
VCQRGPGVVDVADSFVGLDQLRQVADVADEPERQLLERSRPSVALSLVRLVLLSHEQRPLSQLRELHSPSEPNARPPDRAQPATSKVSSSSHSSRSFGPAMLSS